MYAVGTGKRPAFPASLNEEGRDFLNRVLVHDHEQRDTADKLLDHPFTKVCYRVIDESYINYIKSLEKKRDISEN